MIRRALDAMARHLTRVAFWYEEKRWVQPVRWYEPARWYAFCLFALLLALDWPRWREPTQAERDEFGIDRE